MYGEKTLRNFVIKISFLSWTRICEEPRNISHVSPLNLYLLHSFQFIPLFCLSSLKVSLLFHGFYITFEFTFFGKYDQTLLIKITLKGSRDHNFQTAVLSREKKCWNFWDSELNNFWHLRCSSWETKTSAVETMLLKLSEAKKCW